MGLAIIEPHHARQHRQPGQMMLQAIVRRHAEYRGQCAHVDDHRSDRLKFGNPNEMLPQLYL